MGRRLPRLAAATLFACAALSLAATNPTHAAAIQSYTYSTSADLAGVSSGSNYGYPISISGQSSVGMLTTPGTFTLATITTNPLPTGATLSFDNTPFDIDLSVGPVPPSGNGYGYYGGYYNSNPNFYNASPSYFYKILGVLNGTLKGDGTSTLFPTITSITGERQCGPAIRRGRPQIQSPGDRRTQRADLWNHDVDGPCRRHGNPVACAGSRTDLDGDLRRRPGWLALEAPPSHRCSSFGLNRLPRAFPPPSRPRVRC